MTDAETNRLLKEWKEEMVKNRIAFQALCAAVTKLCDRLVVNNLITRDDK